MRNIYHVETPENVTLEFELAGIGSRGVAAGIDMLIQGLFLGIILFIITTITGDISISIIGVQENKWYIVISLLLVFIIQFGYFLLFEYYSKGSTPGKKIIGLKVMMANGEPLSFSASAIRNFIRVADMLPGIYAVGIFSVFFNKRYMRVGDMAANTVVVKAKKKEVKFPVQDATFPDHPPIHISQQEEALLIDYYERRKNPRSPLYSDILEAQLYHHFYGKIGLVPNLPNNFSRKRYLDRLMDYLGIS